MGLSVTKKSALRALIITPAILLLLLVTARILLPWYGPALINLALANTGAHVNSLQINQLGWRRVQLAQLSVTLEQGANVRLHNIQLARPSSEDKYYRVSIESVGITGFAQNPSTPQSPSNNKTLLSNLLPSKLFSGAPSIKLNVGQLTVNQMPQPIASVMLTENIAVALNPEGFQLSAVIKLAQPKDALHVSISVTQGDSLALTILPENAETPMIELLATIAEKKNQLIGEVDITADERVLALIEYEVMDTLPLLQGHLKTEMRFNVHDQPLEAYKNALNHKVSTHEPLSFELSGSLGVFAKLESQQPLQSPPQPEVSILHSLPSSLVELEADFNAGFTGATVENASEGWVTVFSRPNTNNPLLKATSLWQKKQHRIWVELPKPFKFSFGSGEPTDPLNKNKSKIKFTENSAWFMRYTIDNVNAIAAQFTPITIEGLLGKHEPLGFALNTKIEANALPLMLQFGLIGEQGFITDAEKSAAKLAANLRYSANQLNITIEEQAEFGLWAAQSNDVSIERLAITLPPQAIALTLASGLVDQLHWLVTLEGLQFGDNSISAVNFEGQINATAKDFEGRLAVDSFKLNPLDKYRRFTVSPYHLNAQFPVVSPQLLTGAEITAREVIEAAKNTYFTVFNQCDEKLLSGELSQFSTLILTAEKTFTAQGTLSQWLDLPSPDLDLVSGDASLDFKWRFNDPLPSISVTLNDGELAGGLGTVSGVQLGLSTQKAELATRYALTGAASAMNVGILAEDISFSTHVSAVEEGVEVAINALNANVFGGTLSIQDERWRAGSDEVVVLKFKNISLSNIIESQSLEGLHTSGYLSGEQPVSVSANGEFALLKGSLENVEGGVIQYENALSESVDINDQLKLTMDVLKNFEYESLKTETEYQQGKLILHSKISGSNPSVAGGQKVDLNLNTEIGLNSAIEVMRLQAGLEAEVSKMYDSKSRYTSGKYCQKSY